MGPIFKGTRAADGVRVTYNGRPLNTRRRWRNHSPDGFEWGYGGSGPAQLALAMLGTLLQKSLALECYQDFKDQFVAGFPHEGWELDANAVLTWFHQRQRSEAKPP